MDIHRWQQLQEVLDVALESDPTQWSRVLGDMCKGDAELQKGAGGPDSPPLRA